MKINHDSLRTPIPSIDVNPSEAGSYRIELIRKAIHLSSIAIPIFYFFTPRGVALNVLVPLTLAFVVIDVSRYYHRPIETWFNATFGRLLRHHETDRERKRLNGATYVLISATISVFFFPKYIAVLGFLILIIADMAAALVGKRFGRHRFLGKSAEGSLGFFLSAMLIIILTPKIGYVPAEYAIGAAAAAVGTVVEALPVDIDDNLSVPVTVGAALWAGYAFLLPSLDIYKFG